MNQQCILEPVLTSHTTDNRQPTPPSPQGASEDILSAKNALYQHLTWDPSKKVSLCPKLAPPLATPVVVSPPPSPRPGGHDGEGRAGGVGGVV
jgi:hypothetical protein